MRNNTSWRTTCYVCRTSITNVGSGRPKKYCSENCKAKHERRKRQMRAYSRKRFKPKTTVSSIRASNKQLVNAWKLERGECALHPLYNNGERKYVVPGLEYLFDMDHLDRTTKTTTIAKMMGSNQKPKYRKKKVIENLIIEMEKCQLVCVECHRRKTVENRDWVKITDKLEPEIKAISDQLTLFDI